MLDIIIVIKHLPLYLNYMLLYMPDTMPWSGRVQHECKRWIVEISL